MQMYFYDTASHIDTELLYSNVYVKLCQYNNALEHIILERWLHHHCCHFGLMNQPGHINISVQSMSDIAYLL